MASKTAVEKIKAKSSAYGERPYEGVYVWPVDYAKYTEWALLHRGYQPRDQEVGWLTGFYHFNRSGCSPGGFDNRDLDEDGFNEVAFTPIGEQANSWAETTWKQGFPGIYAWYVSDEMRPYYHNAILFIKNDVYVHTEPTYDENGKRRKK